MNRLIVAALAAVACGAAQAQLLVAPGTKATLTVDFDYASAGSKADKFDSRDWKVSRKTTLTAQMVADKQQPLPSMHPQDAAQQADMKNKQEKSKSVAKAMTPMANDMMAIVTKCGEDEACITREVQKYGGNMQMTPELKQAGEDINAIGKEGPPRYQMWKLVSLSGSYSIDETYNSTTTEVTEGPGRKFKRVETRKGGGALPAADSKSASGMLEVDNVKKDIMVMLPTGKSLLGSYTRTVTSTSPDDETGTSKVPTAPIGGGLQQQIVALPNGLKGAFGTETQKVAGADGESGTLTVKWRLAVQ